VALANWKSSSSASVCSTTSASRPRIQRSASVRSASVGSSRSGDAPLVSASLVAFHSFVPKLREPATHSSDSAMSAPGLAPRAIVKRRASAPKRSMRSRGSIVLPLDFDIFLPYWSRISPCRNTCSNGGFPSMAYSPNIIIRTTQKNRMS
jgi:hypothetical protein